MVCLELVPCPMLEKVISGGPITPRPPQAPQVTHRSGFASDPYPPPPPPRTPRWALPCLADGQRVRLSQTAGREGKVFLPIPEPDLYLQALQIFI